MTRILAAASSFSRACHPHHPSITRSNRCVRGIIGARAATSSVFRRISHRIACRFMHPPRPARLSGLGFNLPRREYVDTGKYPACNGAESRGRMTNAESLWKGSSKRDRGDGPSGNRPRLMRLRFSFPPFPSFRASLCDFSVSFTLGSRSCSCSKLYPRARCASRARIKRHATELVYRRKGISRQIAHEK